MKRRIDTIFVDITSTIGEVMKIITEAPHHEEPAPSGIALVFDKQKFVGIVTDGDLRRALLAGTSLDDLVGTITNRNPVSVKYNVSAQEMMEDVLRAVVERNIPDKKIDNILVVDDNDKPVDIISFFELWKRGEIKTRTVSIIGLGYVGLTLGLTFAEVGFNVIGVDTNEEVIDLLKTGRAHFYEKGLDELLSRHVGKRFNVKTTIDPGDSDVYIICVGTPVGDDKQVKLTYLEDAAKNVGAALKDGDLVVLRSTVPIGSCRDLVLPLLEEASSLSVGVDFHLAFAPERTVEGRALEEVRNIPQVIGGYDQRSTDITAKLFGIFVKTIIPVRGLEAAESVKLLNNTFRDLIFSYANEMSRIFDGFGIDTHEVIRAANEGYPRDQIPLPSPGVGGACLTKDPYILMKSSEQIGYTPRLPMVGRDVNDSMVSFVGDKVIRFLGAKKKKDPKIFILGLAFKGQPETSDLRESTPVKIMEHIRRLYEQVYVYDAVANDDEMVNLGGIPISIERGFEQADCVLVLNNHRSFRELPLYTLIESMSPGAMFFDGWGEFGDYDFDSVGILYDGLGTYRRTDI